MQSKISLWDGKAVYKDLLDHVKKKYHAYEGILKFKQVKLLIRNIIISVVYKKRKVNENNLFLNEIRGFGKK